MIVTEFYDGQGLGNQLWVYAAARSIAEQLNVPFALLGSGRFKGKEFLRLENSVGIDAVEVSKVLQSEHWRHFHETYYYDSDLNYMSSGFDSGVLSLSGINKLDGLFQSEKYLFGDSEKLKKYFELDEECKKNNRVADDICIINLRGGEYKRHKRLVLPDSYWNIAVENMSRIAGITKYLVVTDDVRYAREIFPDFHILDGEIRDCYASIYNAQYLILSNSSFAYFPAKTGVAKCYVIAPMYWARFGNELRRWASPANLYESWLWQDAEGELCTYEECLQDKETTEAFYTENYFVKTSVNCFSDDRFRRLIPAPIRSLIKRMLSIFFPKNYG